MPQALKLTVAALACTMIFWPAAKESAVRSSASVAPRLTSNSMNSLSAGVLDAVSATRSLEAAVPLFQAATLTTARRPVGTS